MLRSDIACMYSDLIDIFCTTAHNNVMYIIMHDCAILSVVNRTKFMIINGDIILFVKHINELPWDRQ